MGFPTKYGRCSRDGFRMQIPRTQDTNYCNVFNLAVEDVQKKICKRNETWISYDVRDRIYETYPSSLRRKAVSFQPLSTFFSNHRKSIQPSSLSPTSHFKRSPCYSRALEVHLLCPVSRTGVDGKTFDKRSWDKYLANKISFSMCDAWRVQISEHPRPPGCTISLVTHCGGRQFMENIKSTVRS